MHHKIGQLIMFETQKGVCYHLLQKKVHRSTIHTPKPLFCLTYFKQCVSYERNNAGSNMHLSVAQQPSSNRGSNLNSKHCFSIALLGNHAFVKAKKNVQKVNRTVMYLRGCYIFDHITPHLHQKNLAGLHKS